MNLIKALIELIAEKPAPVECPWQSQKTKPQRSGATLPQNVVYYQNRPFESRQIDDGVYEDTRIMQGGTPRSARIMQGEVESKAFDPAKYAELKKLWAEGMSAAQAARTFKGRRGYGERTLETFWAAFNSVGASEENTWG